MRNRILFTGLIRLALVVCLVTVSFGPVISESFAEEKPAGQAEAAQPGTGGYHGSVAAPTPKPDNGQARDDDRRNQDADESEYAAIFKSLFRVFVLAVLLESALALIFNWRPFIIYFDGRGVRTVISLALSWTVTWFLRLDLVEELYKAAHGPDQVYDLQGVGIFITALVVAGGSAGVNNIFRALGFREVVRASDVVPRPPKERAWIAVRLKRASAVGPVEVLVRKDDGVPEVVGIIDGKRPPPPVLHWALRDPTRFPTAGGLALPGGVAYMVTIRGRNQNGDPVPSVPADGSPPAGSVWGPAVIANGAIIDIQLEL
jgi:hypothetical protein